MRYENLDSFTEMVKERRNDYIPTPYELVYRCFTDLKYDQQDDSFFLKNASSVVETLRSECWKKFKPIEKSFTSEMLKQLVDNIDVPGINPVDAINNFLEKYPDHIYQLSLSNTQSRRSRAGKEFEAIIELILMGAGIPMDSQGNIGKRAFVKKGLGKLVDVVSPGTIEYKINKADTILISAKTTLRERWQEVPEEMSRTGAGEMFLATLDDNASEEVLNNLYEANIRLTTTKSIKERSYPNNVRVVTFEQLLSQCKNAKDKWSQHNYSAQQLTERTMSLYKQIEKHTSHPFVLNYYEKQLAR